MEERYIVIDINAFYYVHDTIYSVEVNVVGYADKKMAEEIAARMNKQYNDRINKGTKKYE